MRAIIVSEENLEREFDITLDKLKADMFDCLAGVSDQHALSRMHRTFNYEICQLKARLRLPNSF